MATDFKTLGRNTQGALIAGAVSVILTFFGAYLHVSYKAGGFSASAGHNAWTGWGTVGSLLLIAALAVVALKVFAADSLPAGLPWNLVAFALAALATIILIIKALTFGPDVSGAGDFSSGPGWSGWILFVTSIVFTAFTALLFKDSGEKLPEFNNKPTAS